MGIGSIKSALRRFMAKHMPTFYNQNGNLQVQQTLRPQTTSGTIRRPVLVKNPPKDLDSGAILDRFAIKR